MKKFQTVFILLILSFFFHSCKKENWGVDKIYQNALKQRQASLPDVLDILDLIIAPTRGYIFITDSSPLASQKPQSYRGVGIGGIGYDENGHSQNFGALTVGNFELPCETDNALLYGTSSGSFPGADALFGQTIPVQLAGNGVAPALNTSFDVPQMLFIESPVYQEENFIYPGMELKWNADENNNNGIGLLLHYNPASIENGSDRANAKNAIERPLHLVDNGSYIITSQDLDGIPAGVSVDFYIGRGNYKRAPLANGENYFGIYSYSVIYHSFTKQ